MTDSLCANNNKFAVLHAPPQIRDSDILCIHDSSAYGWVMAFNYNGKLRPKELMLKMDGSVELIRREETVED